MNRGLPHSIAELRRSGSLASALRELWTAPTAQLDPAARVGSPAWETWYRATNESLVNWVDQCASDSDLSRLAGLVHLQLLAVRKSAAAEVLTKAGWVSQTRGTASGGGYRLNLVHALRVLDRTGDSMGAALLFYEIAAFFYRILAVQEGEKALELSRESIRRSAPHDLEEIDVTLLEASWDLAQARFSRRAPGAGGHARQHVMRLLAQRADKLRGAYREDQPAGGIDLALAMNLEVRACLAWQLGEIDEARSLIYEAVSLLSTQADVDEIRLGVALKTSAMIESVQSNAGFKLAMRSASKSAELFAKYRHPFEWRARHQLAQSYVKANSMDAAEKALAAVHDSIERCVPLTDGIERSYANAEVQLARAWTQEFAVLGPEMVNGLRAVPADDRSRRAELALWRDYATAVARPERPIPLRLVAEGLLQLGIVTLCEGDPQAGQKVLEEALTVAQRNGRTATEVACCLALSEAHALKSGASDSTAANYFRRGRQLLGRVRSSYLAAWELRMSATFRWPVAFFQFDRSWKAVEADVLKTFLQYHLKQADYDVGTAQRSSGLSKSRFYELCRELHISTQLDRGPRTRAPSGNE